MYKKFFQTSRILALMGLSLYSFSARSMDQLQQDTEFQKTLGRISPIPINQPLPANQYMNSSQENKEQTPYPEIIKKIMALRIERLEGDKILEAQKLSHDVFYEEKDIYSFSSFNPFNQRVLPSPIGKILVDDDDYQPNTRWYGALDDNNQIVGCSRVIGRRLDNTLRCLKLVTEVPENLSKMENLVELGRGLIKPEYRFKSLLACRIALGVMSDSLLRKESMIGFSNQPNAYHLRNIFFFKDLSITSQIYPDLKFVLLSYEDMPAALISTERVINYILTHREQARL